MPKLETQMQIQPDHPKKKINKENFFTEKKKSPSEKRTIKFGDWTEGMEWMRGIEQRLISSKRKRRERKNNGMSLYEKTKLKS